MDGFYWQIVLQVLINGLFMGGIYALISVGLTLIFGVMNIINFAHGEFLMLSMYTTYFLFTLFGIDPLISIGICVLIFFVVGSLVQLAVIRPIINAPATNQLIVTMGLMLALQNFALFVWGPTFRKITTSYSELKIALAENIVFLAMRPISFVFCLVMTFVLYLFITRTFTGKALRATSIDRDAALLMGVNVNYIYMLAFGLGVACVGAAGALLSTFFFTFPTAGALFTLTAFVVIVLGGLGHFIGAFAGGLIIGVVEALSGFFISPDVPEAVTFVIFMLVLLLRPFGLFGKK